MRHTRQFSEWPEVILLLTAVVALAAAIYTGKEAMQSSANQTMEEIHEFHEHRDENGNLRETD